LADAERRIVFVQSALYRVDAKLKPHRRSPRPAVVDVKPPKTPPEVRPYVIALRMVSRAERRSRRIEKIRHLAPNGAGARRNRNSAFQF
jgi:hypothetical protein